MEALTLVAVLVAALVGFDLASLAWGVDSREAVGDDHAR
jgi:hypothetical protein